MDQKQSKPKILFICNSTASRLWRILPVAGHLMNQGFTAHVVDTENGFDQSLIDQFDLFVLQMVFDERLVAEIKRQGKKYIFEMDDLITWVPEDHYAKDTIKQHGLKWKKGCYTAIAKADAVTVTNEYLKKYYAWLRPFKKNIHVLPNYVYAPFWIKEPRPRVSDDIRIGYVGGSSHKDDLKILIEPLKKIMAEFPKVKFITMGTGGYSAEDDYGFMEYNHGKDIFKDLPRGRRQHYLGAKMFYYPDKLRSLELDIGVAPVKNNKFTKSKTPIKWMEYATINVPAVCQDFLYGSVIEHGKNGFLARTEEDYYTYLKLLVEDATLRKTMGKQAFQDLINNHLFQDHANEWERVYNKVIYGEK